MEGTFFAERFGYPNTGISSFPLVPGKRFHNYGKSQFWWLKQRTFYGNFQYQTLSWPEGNMKIPLNHHFVLCWRMRWCCWKRPRSCAQGSLVGTTPWYMITITWLEETRNLASVISCSMGGKHLASCIWHTQITRRTGLPKDICQMGLKMPRSLQKMTRLKELTTQMWHPVVLRQTSFARWWIWTRLSTRVLLDSEATWEPFCKIKSWLNYVVRSAQGPWFLDPAAVSFVIMCRTWTDVFQIQGITDKQSLPIHLKTLVGKKKHEETSHQRAPPRIVQRISLPSVASSKMLAETSRLPQK